MACFYLTPIVENERLAADACRRPSHASSFSPFLVPSAPVASAALRLPLHSATFLTSDGKDFLHAPPPDSASFPSLEALHLSLSCLTLPALSATRY
ncbi:hypothetical protein RTBOTA2_005860 [Rhodotorula toruloides]|nr:hypothetical protein RTBOTA2_005860 [Rhodotorula toruloides]